MVIQEYSKKKNILTVLNFLKEEWFKNADIIKNVIIDIDLFFTEESLLLKNMDEVEIEEFKNEFVNFLNIRELLNIIFFSSSKTTQEILECFWNYSLDNNVINNKESYVKDDFFKKHNYEEFKNLVNINGNYNEFLEIYINDNIFANTLNKNNVYNIFVVDSNKIKLNTILKKHFKEKTEILYNL